MGDWTSADGRLGPAANYYAQTLNWQVFPVHGIDLVGKCTCGRSHKETKEIAKHPASPQGQKDATTDTVKLNAWWEENPRYNVALFAKESGYFVIDIDPRSGGDASFEKLKEMAKDALPPTVEAITGVYWSQETGEHVRGRHMIYKCSPDEKFIGNFNAKGLGGIDIKHNGYVLIAPSRHHSGVTYEWKEGHAPWNIEVAEAPEELLNIIRVRSVQRSASGTSYSVGDWDFLDGLSLGDGRVDIKKILEEGISEGNRAVGLYSLACALANKFGTTVDGRLAVESMMLRFNAEMVRPPMEIEGPNSILMHTRRALDWVADNPKMNLYWDGISDWVKDQGMEVGSNLQRQFLSPVTSSTAFNYETDEGTYLAPLGEEDGITKNTANNIGDQMASFAAEGRGLKEVALGGNLNLPKDVDALSGDAGGRPGFRSLSDVGNGRRLVDSFGSTIRYTPDVGWFVWDGNYWKPDAQKLSIREVSKMVSTVTASEVINYGPDDARASEIVKWANQAKSNSRITSMIEQATSDTRIQVNINEWDSSPTLLGVANGVVDLKTGELKSGRPDLHITRRSPISYVPGMTNIRWSTFLDEATNGDKEMQAWLQRAVGYTLTGLNNQDVLFLIYGPPGSGKNTFIETIYEALGKSEYAWALDPNVLALGDRMNSTDEYHMAELRGRRMIWVDELPESERIKENQVKKLTGSGTLQGRSPGEKPIQFTSHGKLWISTNHRPIITDDAMWRRMRPIPLTNKPEVPDPSLKEYLADPEGALPAVLAWAVEGAVKYLNSSAVDPLGWCTRVKEAHDVYKKNEDRIGAFLDEEIKVVVGASINLSSLFQLYKNWSYARDEKNLTQIGFQRKLSDRGIEIIGVGNKATILGYQMGLREVPSTTMIDYSAHARYAAGNPGENF
jgi:P4 family phage/plasmid primase-like protien